MARGPWIDHFGDNFLWSNATLIIKGMAPYGVVALEEMDRACEKLRVRQHEPQAWQEEWGAIAELVEKRADAAAAEGRKASAGDYYLRAGNYFYNAERFILPGEEKQVFDYFRQLNLFFEVRNVFNKTYVASASNVTDSINALGQQNGAASVASSTGAIYAGSPRAFYGGVKLHF